MNSERTAFVAVVTVALLAALVAAPVAARDVAAGSVIFVGEENLNLTAINGTPVATLVYYSDITSATSGIVAKTISVGNSDTFELTAADFGTSTGAWYAFPVGGALTNPSVAAGYVLVRVPSTRLDVKYAGTTETVNAGTVTRMNSIQFDIEHNFRDLVSAATMNIEVTIPSGGVVNVFGSNSADLRGIALTGEKYTSPAIELAGIETGTYTAQAVWPAVSDFYGKGYDSNTVTFAVVTEAPSITVNRGSVVHGYNFVVTITGEPDTAYYLYVKDLGLPANECPWIPAGQPGVQLTNVLGGSPSQANVTTNAVGSRSVQFNTNQSTDDRSFTIRVENQTCATTYDEVRVRVEQGIVTITASGTGVYYIGEEITLSGTNTDSDVTYLFVTGPNLGIYGVNLTNFGVNVVNDNPATFTCADVESDDTWSFRWSTADVGRYIDAGGYTIYAVSQPRNKIALSDVQYATTAIQLRSPFVMATASTVTVTKGDSLTISGTAQGNPDDVSIWIFGKNYGVYQLPVTVESDSSFEYTLESGDTEDLSSGQYFVVIQHPMFYGPGVTVNASGYLQAQGVTPVNLRGLSASDAANTLIDALDSPYVDDIFTKFTFRVMGECWIQIDPIDDPAYGKTFTVAGTTNYPAGTVLHYWIATEGGNVFVLSGETVVADDGDWSIDLDTTTLGPGAFTLRVTAPDSLASAAGVFDIYDDITHPAPSTGATYRVERISANPPLDDLAPDEEAAFSGTISAPWAGNQRNLEFSTVLENPVWSCSIARDGRVIYTKSQSARSLTLTPFELDYEYGKIQVYLTLEGTVPENGAESPVLLKIIERDADDRTLPESEYCVSLTPAGDDPAPPSADNLTLSLGWNFVSIPRPLAAGNDTATIFAAVDTGGRSVFRYNTANGSWIALTATDRLAPLEGFWIYSAGPTTVPLNFSTALPVPPSERGLATGWNAVGVTGTDPATARDTFYSVNGQWTTLIGFNVPTQAFETAVVNGGSGAYADNRSVYPGRGYWLYMTGPGTLCSLGA